MPIDNPDPVPHPAQPGVWLDKLAVESLTLTRGSAVDAPARIAFALRPYAEAGIGEGVAYIAAPLADVPPSEFVIPDVYAWVAGRAQANDTVPAQAMALLVQACGEEFARRSQPAPG